MVKRAQVKKFRLGALSEDDLDEDYVPGRADSTMTADHKSRLDEMAARVRREADKIAGE